MKRDDVWHIELFGGVTLRRGEQTVTRFKTRQAMELFAYLALFPDTAHPRAELTARLWPGEEPLVTGDRFRQALSAVRSVLEPASQNRGASSRRTASVFACVPTPFAPMCRCLRLRSEPISISRH